MLESWIRVISKPEVATFDAEQANASLSRTALSWGIASVASAVFTLAMLLIVAASVVFPLLAASDLQLGPVEGLVLVAMGGAAILYFILSFFSLWISSGVHYLVARLLGGTGSYSVQTYLLSMIFGPLTIGSLVVSFVPCIGGFLQIGVAVYMFVLMTLAFQSVHRFSTGKAVATWLIPGAVMMVIVLAISGVIMLLIVMAIAGASQIN